jgi:hypothetical protein
MERVEECPVACPGTYSRAYPGACPGPRLGAWRGNKLTLPLLVYTHKKKDNEREYRIDI